MPAKEYWSIPEPTKRGRYGKKFFIGCVIFTTIAVAGVAYNEHRETVRRRSTVMKELNEQQLLNLARLEVQREIEQVRKESS